MRPVWGLETPVSEPPEQATPPPSIANGDARRCHWCGYSLRGLAATGNCPECGRTYDVQTSRKLQPWPSPLLIIIRLGWPVAGLAVAVAGVNLSQEILRFQSLILGYGCLVAVPINSYFQVRSMLKRHLPEGKRTQGPIATLRALGTAVCVLAAITFFIPVIALGACLVMLAGANF